jgi:hypothetical protein
VRKVLFVLAAALALVPAASARNPHDQTEPSPSVTVVVDGPTKVGSNANAVPAGGPVAPAATAAASPADCGACITSCWNATVRSGPSDWSGHVYIIHSLGWCGNGAWITAAGMSQRYEQAGWYQLSGTYGPWWSGGCIGCSSISAYGYITWNWSMQLTGISHSGTTVLNPTMYAWGGLGY